MPDSGRPQQKHRRVGKPRCLHAHEQCPHEARAYGDGNPIQFMDGLACHTKRFVHDWNDRAQVIARGHFGNHAPIRRMKLNLAFDDIAEDIAGMRYNCCRSFIA
jgi:hypothetical protein